MKHRITYLLPAFSTSTFDPRQSIKVFKDSVRISDLPAAKEHRLTLSLSELPQELVRLLDGVKTLHVRGTAPHDSENVVPVASRASVGWNVFVELVEGGEREKRLEALCRGLKDVLGDDVKCDGADSFSLPSHKSSAPTSPQLQQWHSLLPSLQRLSTYVTNKICQKSTGQCSEAAGQIAHASFIDLDYDNELDEVIINAYWDAEVNSEGWSEIIEYKGPAHERVEVGVLNQEKSAEEKDIKMGGWLTVVGHDVKPKTTLFSFPSRHHLHSSSFAAAFNHPTGLHPTLRLKLDSSALNPPQINATCTLNTYLTLPSFLFLDRHAFTDALFLRSHNLKTLRSVSGATDLEAPDWAVRTWGSAALFELDEVAVPSPSAGAGEVVEVTIPLHLRYMTPTPGGYTNATMPYPIVFWACNTPQDSDFNPTGNPFDRRHLGYDGLFDDTTVFYHVEPKTTPAPSDLQGGGRGKLTLDMRVPVLDLDHAWYVEPVTAGVVVLAVLWVLWKTLGPVKGGGKRKVK